MIAEVLLVLAGHSSSLFPTDHTLHPAFIDLLHPGEQQCLESIGLIAFRYRMIKSSCIRLSHSSSRLVCTLCGTLGHILRDEYEYLIVETERSIFHHDENLLACGSFVPLSSIRATFAEWDMPFAVLITLLEELESQTSWNPGPLIDILLERSRTGVRRVADILSRLSVAVQRAWRTQLTAFLVHGSLSLADPLASLDYILLEGSIPSCVSVQSRESIGYVGRAVGTVKSAKWQKQLPPSLAIAHAKFLENVLPEDQHAFDSIISKIRIDVSEWLWLNVLTQKDVEEAVDSLGNYFLLLDGEFSLSLIREIEHLKLSRLTLRSGLASVIRERDLDLALLRASLGTTAQYDPSLNRLSFSLLPGPPRALPPSLEVLSNSLSPSELNTCASLDQFFSSCFLGTPLTLRYAVTWPLDLFLHPVELSAYTRLFSYLSALRRGHLRIQGCWTTLSNAQRARRRWTGLGEGGTTEDIELRSRLLRCSWGLVRDMSWFLDTLLSYIMTDVIDVEFRNLKAILSKAVTGRLECASGREVLDLPRTGKIFSKETGWTSDKSTPTDLDFTTLRQIHMTYLDRLLSGCLLTSPALTSILAQLLEICENLVAQVERWGGDVLPALLLEGSLKGFGERVGNMVQERRRTVEQVNKSLQTALDSFYEQLLLSISQQPIIASSDASKSIVMNASLANYTTASLSRGPWAEGGIGEVRRHFEQLMLKLDFNFEFSKRQEFNFKGKNILLEGGIF